jgi:cyclohexa-1,5-dienecarbonyl-CoA hydratase
VAVSPAVDPVDLAFDGARATITLRRPPLNLLSIGMLDALRSRVKAADRPDVRVLVLRGEGKAFSAGVDVADHTEERVGGMMRAFREALEALLAFPAPTVAAIHGPCLGGGLELALACDLAYAAEGATFGQPEIEVGVFPPFAVVALPPIIGERRAREITLLGQRVTASEAKTWGLVNDCFPDAGFPAAIERVVALLSSHSGAVSRLTKRAHRIARTLPFDSAWATIDRLYVNELMPLEDAREGLAAFLEKRKPEWRDR